MGGIDRALGIMPGNPFRAPMLVLLAVGVVSVLAMLAALVTGAGERIWIASITFWGTALLILAIYVPLARAHQRAMDDLLATEAWVRWSLGREEWDRYAAREWATHRRDAWFIVRVCLGLGVVLGLLGAVFLGDLSMRSLAAAVVVALVVGLLGLAGGGIHLADGWWQYAGADDTECEIVIGPRGLVFRGRYRPLAGPFLRLKAAVIEPGDPPTLCFTTVGSMGSEQKTGRIHRVPIPRGREAEAGALVERFGGARA